VLKDHHENGSETRPPFLQGFVWHGRMGIACTWPVAAAESLCSSGCPSRDSTSFEMNPVPVGQQLQVVEVNATQAQDKYATMLLAANGNRRRSLLQKPKAYMLYTRDGHATGQNENRARHC
jgi:hypothetical protein